MRLVVLSDIHGNLLALKAVLDDIDSQGSPDFWWVLGDLAVFCPWPAETLARLRALPDAAFVQGNTDRYLVTGRRPIFPVRSPEDWARMPAVLGERDANFHWTVARLCYDDFLFLRDLPTQLELDVPRYGRVVAVHGAPGDDEVNLLADTPEDQVRAHLAGLDARLLISGHTHRPMDRTVGAVRLVNDGSVGMPLDGDPRPAYTLLDFTRGRCKVTLRRVEYDRDAVFSELERVEHPARRFVGWAIREASIP